MWNSAKISASRRHKNLLVRFLKEISWIGPTIYDLEMEWIFPTSSMIMKALLQLLALSSSAVGVAFAPARCHFAGCNIPRGSNGLIKANRHQSQHAFLAPNSRDHGFKSRFDRVRIVKSIRIEMATALRTKFAELETILTRLVAVVYGTAGMTTGQTATATVLLTSTMWG